MASSPLNVKRRVISKSFHRILDTYSKQTFTGALLAGGRRGAVACTWRYLPGALSHAIRIGVRIPSGGSSSTATSNPQHPSSDG